jgi:S-adenosylmethionine decarboxylase
MVEKEYCSVKDDIKYAGTQLIIEVWNGRHFASLPEIRKMLEEAVTACKVTLLKIDLHKFSPSGGISGVAVIQESHISIHTWPEYNYAAVDIFVCGNVNPYKAVGVVKKCFQPEKVQVVEFKRGVF